MMKETPMRRSILLLASILCAMSAAKAQPVDVTSPPRMIGNRTNGFSYQPSPGEVRPKEQIAGVRQSRAHQALTDQTLMTLDRTLLQDEGLSVSNVPAFRPDH
jgi:hypothetical protein